MCSESRKSDSVLGRGLPRARCQAWGGGEVGNGRGELGWLPESESGWGFLEATVSSYGWETETQRADRTWPTSRGKS